MWYTHYCALAHFSLEMQVILNSTHHNQWIARGGQLHGLHDHQILNLLDFYLRKHLKPLVYAAPIDNENT
jgi:hypothetical protein